MDDNLPLEAQLSALSLFWQKDSNIPKPFSKWSFSQIIEVQILLNSLTASTGLPLKCTGRVPDDDHLVHQRATTEGRTDQALTTQHAIASRQPHTAAAAHKRWRLASSRPALYMLLLRQRPVYSNLPMMME